MKMMIDICIYFMMIWMCWLTRICISKYRSKIQSFTAFLHLSIWPATSMPPSLRIIIFNWMIFDVLSLLHPFIHFPFPYSITLIAKSVNEWILMQNYHRVPVQYTAEQIIMMVRWVGLAKASSRSSPFFHFISRFYKKRA